MDCPLHDRRSPAHRGQLWEEHRYRNSRGRHSALMAPSSTAGKRWNPLAEILKLVGLCMVGCLLCGCSTDYGPQTDKARTAKNESASNEATSRPRGKPAATEENASDEMAGVVDQFLRAMEKKDLNTAAALLDAHSDLDSFRLKLMTSGSRYESFRGYRRLEVTGTEKGELRGTENRQRWPLVKLSGKLHYDDEGPTGQVFAVLVHRNGRWAIFRLDVSRPKQQSADQQAVQRSSPGQGELPSGIQPPPAGASPLEHDKYQCALTLEALIRQLAKENLSGAAELTSSEPPSTLGPAQLRALIAGGGSDRLRQYATLEIGSFGKATGRVRNLPGFRGTSARAWGRIHYQDGSSVKFQAVLVVENDQWRVYSFQITGPSG